MLMHQLLRDGAARTPDKIALRWVDRNIALSFADAVAAMERYAGALHALGVGKGDRVTVIAHNGMDYVLGLFACWRIGAIAALVNVRFADELDYYFADHSPCMVIYTHDLGDKVGAAASRAPSIAHLVCMDGPQSGAESLPDLIAADLPAPPDPSDENAIAHLSYTSGTTGRPKGACLAHEPTMRACHCIAERLRLRPDDVSFGPTALSSSYQLVGNLLPPLFRGATVNVMGRWTQASGFDALQRTGATLFVANPTLLGEVLAEAGERGSPPARLRLGLSGGGPVSPSLKAAWRDQLKLPLVESYGQSELGGFFALGEPELIPDARLGPVGRPLPDKEVRILDAEGREVPVGAIGEICMRGGFMTRYWGNPDQTAQALRGGWLHSGDAGIMDRDGYLTMRGRFAELIKVGSTTWFPRDVEEALCSRPDVKEAAVVGLPDPVLGQRPIGYVTTHDAEVDLEGLKRAIAMVVPYDLSPLTLVKLSAFPMTPTGKIAKAQLRAEAMAGATA
jgi:long-chain acyl-CoA synthetase